MKPFAKRLLALASAAAITFSIIPTVGAVNVLTDKGVSAAEEMHSTTPLSRQDLASLVMDTYKSRTGLTDVELGEPVQVFTDSDDTDVLNAHHLGLVPGKTAGIFAPNGTLTREEVWTVAAELLELLGYPCSDEEPLQILVNIGAITAEYDLDPAAVITTGEAVELLVQVENSFTQWQEESMKPRRYLGEDVVEVGLSKVGCRYVSGGHGPNKFDCSGFVYYVYKQFGYDLKPGARNQWSMLGDTVKRADLLPGDLVFFSNNGRSGGIFHVGIYIGDGQFVHAANSRRGVIVTDMDEEWYANRYLGAKRAI